MRTSTLAAFEILAGVFTLIGASSSVHGQNTAPRFELRTCDYPAPASAAPDVTRECGYLIVPEVRGRANGRTFRLDVVIYRAKEPDGTPPLLLLHGGPTGAGGTRLPWGELRAAHTRRRDVVTFDNRGVSGSEPKFCPEFEQEAGAAFYRPTRKEWEEGYRTAVRACIAKIDAQGLDRSAFGADVNAADARDLRRALGYEKWDIYGVSYGGLVAQELMRLDPQGIRAASLVSTVPFGPVHMADRALSQQHLMERIFSSCAAQPTCQRAFPTLEADFYALYDELAAKPIEISITETATPRTVLLNGERLLMELRRELVQPNLRARVPLLIHEMRRGDQDTAFRRLIGDGVIPPWDALGRVIQCNEYGAGYRAAVAATLPMMRPPFRTIADDFREHCDLWLPNPTRQADTRPVVSNIPTLVLHGEYEGTDVKAAQQRITAGLTQAYTFTFPGEGHAGPPVGCHGAIVHQFLENPMRAPDSSCIARMQPIAFKTRSFAPTVTFTITSGTGAPTQFAGTWEATLGGGPDLLIAIEINGDQVRGAALPQELPLFDGRVADGTLTFKVKSPDGARTITFTGKLQADGIAFTRDVETPAGGRFGGPGLFGAVGPRTLIARRIEPD